MKDALKCAIVSVLAFDPRVCAGAGISTGCRTGA